MVTARPEGQRQPSFDYWIAVSTFGLLAMTKIAFCNSLIF
jgi:hypothetical protein